jgi:hypothetical protein
MAFTVTTIKKTIMGNQRCNQLLVVADAATQAVATGLQYIDFVTVAPRSMASAAGHFKLNVDASGTAANGTLAITGVANGDEMYIAVYGK